MSEIEQYQSDHLFLLMGENPLPNYIAAISLLKPQGTAFLIHTERTQLQAQRLQTVLGETKQFQSAYLINLGNKQADAYCINQEIKKYAKGLQGAIGLNYTGGNKAMSVHAYRTIEQIYPKAVFSYLDSNTLEMYVDNDIQSSDRIKISPQLSLSQIFQLHGLVWRVPPSDHPILPKLAGEFAKLYQNPKLSEAWKQWRGYFRQQTRDSRWWKEESELQKLML